MSSSLLKKWKDLLPLNQEQQQVIDKYFLVDFNYNSNHIEGNTLTYGQTELLLMFGETTGNASMQDYEQMKGHNVGLELVKQYAKDKERELTESFIRELNRVILVRNYWKDAQTPDGNNTRIEIKVGEYKTRPNSVITSTGEMFNYASPEETPFLMNDLLDWYKIESKNNNYSPIELASILHYRFIRIHPFEDGNGRIARLLINYVLLRNNLPILVIQSSDKKEYLRILHQCDINVGYLPSKGANANKDTIKPFTDYLLKEFEHSLGICINLLLEGKSGTINNSWWYNGEQVIITNQTQDRIINILEAKPNCSIRELSKIIEINKSAIQKHLDKLRTKGYIERKGGTKGLWLVNLRKQ